MLQLRIESMRHNNVYRTILVPEDATFADLLVCEMVLLNLKVMKEPIFESNNQNEGAISQNETLKKWFQQIGDEVQYKYEGQQPIIKIVFEQRVIIPLNAKYPICISGNGNLFNGRAGFINLNFVNEQLKYLFMQQENKPSENKEINEKPNYAKLLKVADDLKKSKPWNDVTEEQVIELKDNTHFAQVRGSKGERFGVDIYEELPRASSSAKFIVSFVNRDDLTKEDYQLIKDNGFSFRGKNNWIQFRVKKQGQAVAIPENSDVNEIAEILEMLSDVLSNKEMLKKRLLEMSVI